MEWLGRKRHTFERCIVVVEIVVIIGDEEDRRRAKAHAVDRSDLIIADRRECNFVR